MLHCRSMLFWQPLELDQNHIARSFEFPAWTCHADFRTSRILVGFKSEPTSTHVWFLVQPFHLQLVFEASALFFVIADLCNALVSDCDNILCSPPFNPPECFAMLNFLLCANSLFSKVEPMYQYSLEWLGSYFANEIGSVSSMFQCIAIRIQKFGPAQNC